MKQFSIKRMFAGTGLIAVGCWLITLVRIDAAGPSTEVITAAIILAPAMICAGVFTLFHRTAYGFAFGIYALLVVLLVAMAVGVGYAILFLR